MPTWDLGVLFVFSVSSKVSIGMALPGAEDTKKLGYISQLSTKHCISCLCRDMFHPDPFLGCIESAIGVGYS